MGMCPHYADEHHVTDSRCPGCAQNGRSGIHIGTLIGRALALHQNACQVHEAVDAVQSGSKTGGIAVINDYRSDPGRVWKSGERATGSGAGHDRVFALCQNMGQ